MSFEDRPFLILLAVTYGLWLLVRRNERAAVALFFAASLVFYGHNHWRLLPILLLYCAVDWGVAVWLEQSSRPKAVMWLGVGFNLAVLASFKYVPMLVTTFAGLTGVWLLPEESIGPKVWALPFAISFYAFTGIAYVVDVYRKEYPAERNFARYTLSAVFFPHLVAGPILRANEFLCFVRPGRMPTAGRDHLEAAWLVARGYFKKMVLANRIGMLIDPFFAHVADGSTAGVWSLPYVYLYALQILLDFSAYTDIARGLGLLFGYRWPDNFDRPYLAASVADFWKRWHVTLSRFLRDYLYVPLGGNRGGLWRTCVNLMVTMLLGGLWHGASWSFLLWGGLHGAFLVAHRLWRETRYAKQADELSGLAAWLWRAFAVALTFHCVCLAWCFFRLTALGDSLACVRKGASFDADKMLSPALLDPSLGVLLAAYAAASWAVARLDRWAGEDFVAGARWGLRGGVVALAVLLSPGGAASPFIYFQF